MEEKKVTNGCFELLRMWSWQSWGGMGCQAYPACALGSADLATVWLQSSWESVQGCVFHPVTLPAVSRATDLFEYTNNLSIIVRYLWNTQHKALNSAHVVCLGSSPMSHLMTRPNSQGDSSSLRGGMRFSAESLLSSCLPYSPKLLFLTDSAWQYGSPGFLELKAEVTEVPAPSGLEDNTGLRYSPLCLPYMTIQWFKLITVHAYFKLQVTK